MKCPCCGATAGTDIEVVTGFHPGDFMLSAVVTDALYQNLPARAGDELKVGCGRKLLVFSDNRQDAGQFAYTLQRTSEDILLRWAVMKVFSESDERQTLRRLRDNVTANLGGVMNFLDKDGKVFESRDDFEDFVCGRLAAEFCLPTGRRNSLEALGLVRVIVMIRRGLPRPRKRLDPGCQRNCVVTLPPFRCPSRNRAAKPVHHATRECQPHQQAHLGRFYARGIASLRSARKTRDKSPSSAGCQRQRRTRAASIQTVAATTSNSSTEKKRWNRFFPLRSIRC